MTPRQRVLTSLNHQEPDRVPVFVTLTPQMASKLERALNLPLSVPVLSFLSTRLSHHKVLLKLGNDAVGIGACYPISSPIRHLEDGTIKDEWRIRYKRIGYYDEAIERPLSEAKSLTDVRAYHFPDPLAEGRYNLAKEMIKRYKDDYAIVADLECTIFELSWGLVGMEKFLVDLLFKRPYIFELVDEQKILPFGSPHQVEEEVREKIKSAGLGGGYILAPAHNIQPDTPVESVFKIYEAVNKWGRYPL